MGKVSSAAVYAVLTLIFAAYGFHYRDLGAWSCVATWSFMGVASWFWSHASEVDERAKRTSEMASAAFVKGVSMDSSMTRSELKKGALMSIGSICFAFMGLIMWFGTLSFGIGWAMMGGIPMVVIGYKSAVELMRGTHEQE